MKGKPEGSTLNGFLDKGSHLQGELLFEETFRIDGHFQGKIRSGSELILGDTADVTGEIEVGRLSVNGSLKGTVRATERVELHSRARVEADVTTPVLKIEEGARFDGSCRMAEGSGSNVVDLASTPRKQ
ncbi:MAG TPA: polymer-forming cytoskeletal protein [Thermoanaerobaculia bacterium]|nr:polymer-forming cytoskeletal protein [Thermoanaerobaculia bacterium]